MDGITLLRTLYKRDCASNPGHFRRVGRRGIYDEDCRRRYFFKNGVAFLRKPFRIENITAWLDGSMKPKPTPLTPTRKLFGPLQASAFLKLVKLSVPCLPSITARWLTMVSWSVYPLNGSYSNQYTCQSLQAHRVT